MFLKFRFFIKVDRCAMSKQTAGMVKLFLFKFAGGNSSNASIDFILSTSCQIIQRSILVFNCVFSVVSTA